VGELPLPPLLVFLEEYPALFAAEVLPRLGCGDFAVLAQVAHPLLAAVVAAAAVDSGLQRAGKIAGVPLLLVEFLGSAERLAWAKSNGCPWTEETCAIAALGGHLAALRWARGHGQGLRLVHVRAQLEQLQDTFMNEVGLPGGHKSSS
jgi:hypothetical protein